MRLTPELIETQIRALLEVYPDLQKMEHTDSVIKFQGSIFINRIHNEYTLQKSYDLQIVLPINNDNLPYVVDINDNISPTYHHKYTDGTLCLSTNTDFHLKFLDGFNILVWMRDFVEPFYFSYEYYQRYDIFPFNERSHGYIGVIETYQDIFHTDNGSQTLNVMHAIATAKAYRGHHLCLCGSGLKVRNCHREVLQGFFFDKRKRDILTQDLIYCVKQMEERRRNGKH